MDYKADLFFAELMRPFISRLADDVVGCGLQPGSSA